MLEQTAVNNIKISLYLTKGECLLSNILNLFLLNHPSKSTNSYFILREHSFIYTLFFSGHINITSLKTGEDIVNGIEHIKKRLKYSGEHKLKVDNISSSGFIGKIPKFTTFLNSLKTETGIISVRYSNSVFSSAFIKFKKGGTVCLSKTGNFSIVGANSLEIVLNCSQLLTLLKEKHDEQL